MFKYTNKCIILLILLSLNGCENSNKNDNSKTITKSNISTSNKKDNKILTNIGISTQDDKIIIEPKKTKEFLNKLANRLKKEATKLESKVKNINEKDIGIEANKDKITIDVNKTDKVLKNFSKELESIAKDINKVIK